MKKIVLFFVLAFGISQFTNAQVDFGIKGGINYNNNGKESFKDATNDIADGASAKTVLQMLLLGLLFNIF